MFDSETSTDSNSQPVANSAANYVELATTLIPQPHNTIVAKQMLRSACSFFPMPLAIGWESDESSNIVSSEILIQSLVITDIASGASREVRAAWMHILYRHTSSAQPRGATYLRLIEASFSRRYRWSHFLVLLTILLQCSLAIFAIVSSRWVREGWLILAGLFIRTLECLYQTAFPTFSPPREVKSSRYYALHTGMSTRHMLILEHRPDDPKALRYQLEDTAVPLKADEVPNTKPTRVPRFLGRYLKRAVHLAGWLQMAACVVTSSQGYLYSIAQLPGTVMLHLIASSSRLQASFLPALSTSMPQGDQLETGENMLDIITAACQTAGAASVGFIEAILPDRSGEHVDYKWIMQLLEQGPRTNEHPTHPERSSVLQSALRRRTPRHDINAEN